MVTFRSLVVPALFVLSQACATSAVGRFDATRVAELARPRVDRSQVRAWFGEPDEVVRADGAVAQGACVEAWHWANPSRETFQNLAVYFDAQGAVCDHAFSGPPRPRQSLHLNARRFNRDRMLSSSR